MRRKRYATWHRKLCAGSEEDVPIRVKNDLCCKVENKEQLVCRAESKH